MGFTFDWLLKDEVNLSLNEYALIFYSPSTLIIITSPRDNALFRLSQKINSHLAH